MATEPPRSVRASFKTLARAAALVLACPAGAICWLERVCSDQSENAFVFFVHCYALLPGLPGVYLRRAFFQLTLERCSAECYIGFGSLFTHRHVIVEDRVYVGQYSLIGCAVLRAGCLVGSHTSLLSGPALHEWGGDRGWLPSNPQNLQRIEIGRASWIGERAVVMADVGDGAMVAAGSVVSSPVPPGVVVAGNPARFARRIVEAPADAGREVASSVMR